METTSRRVAALVVSKKLHSQPEFHNETFFKFKVINAYDINKYSYSNPLDLKHTLYKSPGPTY